MTEENNENTYEEKLNVMASFDDERYKEFGRRICAQEYTHQVDQADLIKLKELVHQRFSEDGPWPNAEKNLEEGEALLQEVADDGEKKLVKIAMNSIENSL